MKKLFIMMWLLAANLVWVPVVSVQAAEVESEKATAQLIRFLNDLKSMEASFEQWVMDAKQNALRHSNTCTVPYGERQYR